MPYSVIGFGQIRRNPLLMMLVGVSVNIAMFTERIIVVIPAPSRNILTWGNFTPDWVGISITAGAVGLFGFLYTLLTKFIPIVSMWEYNEGEHAEGLERVGGALVPVTAREDAIG